MIAVGRRRVLSGVALAALGVGIWSANAGTVQPRSAATANLVAQLEKICKNAQPGTYGLPGHYCDSVASLGIQVTGESIDRIANEIQRAAIQGTMSNGALADAINQKLRLLRKGQGPGDGNRWTANGSGPLQVGDADYAGVNGLGLVENGGRITDYSYDSKHRTVYASSAGGGLYRSKDYGAHWTSIGDNLPTLLVGSVGYSPAQGGTLVVVTGDGSFGASSLEGAGVFRSTNQGKSWTRAKGAPSDAFGFRVAVDPSNANVVYAATGAGLFRSSNAGRSFSNVKLPTGACAGKSNRVRPCTFANVVTDVVVQAPGGFNGSKGGAVLAAVGWRGGQVKNPDGTVQAPSNGIYTSATGKPGTFAKSLAAGFTQQDRIGRIGLGATTGTDQNHDYVYALVQNAKAVQKGGIPQLPAVDDPAGAVATVNGKITSTYKAVNTLDGVFVSPNFGQTWVKMADGVGLADPTTGSALAVTGPALAGYGAGVQAWYNQFIKPDPTRTVGGVPTRLLFGLEEVWENEDVGLPQNKPTHFRVIGRYFSGNTCLFLGPVVAGAPYLCPTNRGEALDMTTTTHPDQHAVLFIPDGEGGVRLLVGNDGGAFTQRTGPDPTDDFQNAKWGNGSNKGMTNLLPYNVARAKDGTIWMGLQDNGTAKITNIYKKGKLVQKERQIEALGGDGFFVGVNPNNSNRAYGEYVGGAMSGTVDGGKSWNGMSPPITHGLFSTPFAVDPLDPDHVMIAGNEVVETGSGPSTGSEDWAQVYDLGTAKHPGTSTEETGSDASNVQTALDVYGPRAYVAYCGVCDVLSETRPFKSGIATNVNGRGAPSRYKSSGWHIAKAIGLPERYVTSIQMDEKNPKVVYATLGSYSRRWTPPGTLSGRDDTGGHLYKSVDAGEHFFDISGDLPKAPVNWVTLHGSQLVVATDLGVFASQPKAACAAPATRRCSFEVLGKGMPAAPVMSMQLAPWDCNLLTAASFGRGAYTYRFGAPKPCGNQVKPVIVRPQPFKNKVLKTFDFESDAQGWVAKTTDANGIETWRRGSPGHSGSSSFQVIPYTDDTTATLQSPKLHLAKASTVLLSWWKAQRTEDCCDGLAVDWSSDNHIWHNVSSKTTGTFPQFSQDKSPKFAAPAGDFYLRFRMTSDSLVSAPAYLGVLLDDVEIRY
ncbi:MAG TPA: hypothetical protein VMZ11_00260 [Mycobacteriales bacterium]|nr:hypothetical protein [Mycobacteriales bacterium]